MTSVEFDDFELLENEHYIEHDLKPKAKARKRKWREIENIKEKRRLRRELEQYDSYFF